MLVESMKRSGWPWTPSLYVCIPVYLSRCNSGSMLCEVIISPLCPMSKYATMAMVGVRFVRTFILVESMAQSGWPWTNRKYVCMSGAVLLGLIQCHILILIRCHDILQWRSPVLIMLVESMERSGWPWTNRRYVGIPVLELEVALRVQFSVRSHSHAYFFVKIYYHGDGRC